MGHVTRETSQDSKFNISNLFMLDVSNLKPTAIAKDRGMPVKNMTMLGGSRMENTSTVPGKLSEQVGGLLDVEQELARQREARS